VHATTEDLAFALSARAFAALAAGAVIVAAVSRDGDLNFSDAILRGKRKLRPDSAAVQRLAVVDL